MATDSSKWVGNAVQLGCTMKCLSNIPAISIPPQGKTVGGAQLWYDRKDGSSFKRKRTILKCKIWCQKTFYGTKLRGNLNVDQRPMISRKTHH